MFISFIFCSATNPDSNAFYHTFPPAFYRQTTSACFSSCCLDAIPHNTAAGGKKVNIVKNDLQTNPNVLDPPLHIYPVILNTAVPVDGVEVLAE